MRERRTEVRMLCADVIEVSWKEGGGKRFQQAIGLKFRPGTQWSEDVFLPQHLLDTVALEIPVQ
jgi:hypothetical protein